MKAADRDAEMARFRDGELDVLVGTTVIEVGVDVPEATMMVIQGADRFGLAQLHQLRGRVGRGTRAVVLRARLRLRRRGRPRPGSRRCAELRDGFELAESDFELRREGDVLGLAQSGLPQPPRRLAPATRPTSELAVARPRRAEAMLDEAGRLRPARRARRRARPTAGCAQRARGAPTRGARLTGGRQRRAGDRRHVPAGIRLVAPGAGTRPLGDRVKQTLFAILEPELPGARSSTCSRAAAPAGIEALSRGAATATFVERDAGGGPPSIRANLARTAASTAPTVRVVRDDVAVAGCGDGPDAGAAPFDLVVVDPPYDEPQLLARRARQRCEARRIAPGGRVVAKHFWRDGPAGPGRTATIGARAPVRRDDADVLPRRRRRGGR